MSKRQAPDRYFFDLNLPARVRRHSVEKIAPIEVDLETFIIGVDLETFIIGGMYVAQKESNQLWSDHFASLC